LLIEGNINPLSAGLGGMESNYSERFLTSENGLGLEGLLRKEETASQMELIPRFGIPNQIIISTSGLELMKLKKGSN
jgi:hypothetical protein